jgi:ATP-dependent Clp protease ATP-binding subunit ClpB
MSEFMEQHSVARLIGAPPGYVGYEEGGRLTEAVRRHPYSVVLFDEIEKAHRDVFNVLLQVLDDGRLTDGQGRTVDFKNTIIVMTSNIASEHIARLAGEGAQQWEVEAQLQEALRRQFRPEFLNRIDEIIVFHPLGKADLTQIIQIQLRHVRRRLAGRGVTLEVTQAAQDLIGEMGYDATFGARPLKRLIQQKVENRLAEMILTGQAGEGDAVTLDAKGKSFLFAVQRGTGQTGAGRVAGQPAGEAPSEGGPIEGELVE